MGTIADKLLYLKSTVDSMKQAFTDMGIEVGAGIPLRECVDRIRTIPSGRASGGETCVTGGGKYLIEVFDYDGTILKAARLNSGETFTLPSAPSHERLIFQEWSCPYPITNNTITVRDQDLSIGAVYKTASGKCEFDILLTRVTGLTVQLYLQGTIEWGDGNSQTSTATSVTHTYAAAGNYTIKVSGVATISRTIFGQTEQYKNYYLLRAFLCEGITSVAEAFRSCSTLEIATLPRGVTDVGNSIFCYCHGLRCSAVPSTATRVGKDGYKNCSAMRYISLPRTLETLDNQVFYYCYAVRNFVIPDGITAIGYGTFQSCVSLQELRLPDGIMSIGNSALNYCYPIKLVKLPSALTSIGTNALAYGYATQIYDFRNAASIPTMSDTNAFYYINKAAKIVVPDHLYNEWVVATNWSTYADYIYKASEVQL